MKWIKKKLKCSKCGLLVTYKYREDLGIIDNCPSCCEDDTMIEREENLLITKDSQL